MSGPAEKTRASTGRASAVKILLVVLSAAVLAGFLLGAVAGEGKVDIPPGWWFAAVFLLLGLGAVAWAWWWTRRRAARFGLSASRYTRVGRRLRRGELPEGDAELSAAIDIVTRQRRVLDTQQHRWGTRLTAAVALLWLVSAASQILEHNYGYACFQLLVAGTFLVNPLTMRRQRRRLEAVEQALARQHPQGTSGAPQTRSRRPRRA